MAKETTHSWLIVCASFCISFMTDGIVFSFGVLLIDLLNTFNQGRAPTAIVGAAILGFMHLTGPVVGLLSDRFGFRAVVIAGSLISSAGFLITTFVDQLAYMYVTYGLIGGCGFSLMLLPSRVCVIKHFEKRRGLATGISTCGSGAGVFAFNQINGTLLELYGWRGTVLIQSAIALNGVVCGLFLVAPETPGNGVTKGKIRNTKDDSETDDQALKKDDSKRIDHKALSTENPKMPLCQLPSESGNAHNTTVELMEMKKPVETLDDENDVYTLNEEIDVLMARTGNTYSRDPNHVTNNLDTTQEVAVITIDSGIIQITNDDSVCMSPGERQKCKCSCGSLCDISLLKNGKLLAFLLSGFCMNLAFTVPFSFIPDQAKELGMDNNQAYWLASSMGVSNLISRVLIGWIADRKFVNRIVLVECILWTNGVATGLSVLLKTFQTKIIYTSLYGFLIGGYVALVPVVLADLIGVDVIARAFGLFMFVVGISGIIASPLAGWLYDYTGSYVISFVTAGSESILAACVLLLPFLIKCLCRRDSKHLIN